MRNFGGTFKIGEEFKKMLINKFDQGFLGPISKKYSKPIELPESFGFPKTHILLKEMAKCHKNLI